MDNIRRIEQAARENKFSEVEKLLPKVEDTGEALIYAVENNNLKIVELLYDKSRMTSRALDFASSLNFREIVSFLLSKGAKISPYCVHWAAFSGNEEILQMLLKNGASVNKDFTNRFVYNRRICNILGVNYWTQNFFPMTILV